MAIENDLESNLTVDTETGEYLECGDWHWQAETTSFVLYDKSGDGLIAADVSVRSLAENKTSSIPTVRYFGLRKTWFPTGSQEIPAPF